MLGFGSFFFLFNFISHDVCALGWKHAFTIIRAMGHSRGRVSRAFARHGGHEKSPLLRWVLLNKFWAINVILLS